MSEASMRVQSSATAAGEAATDPASAQPEPRAFETEQDPNDRLGWREVPAAPDPTLSCSPFDAAAAVRSMAVLDHAPGVFGRGFFREVRFARQGDPPEVYRYPVEDPVNRTCYVNLIESLLRRGDVDGFPEVSFGVGLKWKQVRDLDPEVDTAFPAAFIARIDLGTWPNGARARHALQMLHSEYAIDPLLVLQAGQSLYVFYPLDEQTWTDCRFADGCGYDSWDEGQRRLARCFGTNPMLVTDVLVPMPGSLYYDRHGSIARVRAFTPSGPFFQKSAWKFPDGL